MSSSPTQRKKVLSRKRRGGGQRKDSFSSLASSLHSIGEDASVDAPWRVENIRTQGSPSGADWWKREDETTMNGPDGGGGEENEENGQHQNMDSEVEQNGEAADVSFGGDGAEFHNCGLETWEAARKKWTTGTVKERPPHPPPVRYDEVVRGLTQVVRTYELPGRMTLPDIVDVFVDIWECEKDY